MLCLCIIVITSFLGLSAWQANRTHAPATATWQALLSQATATHVARVNDLNGYEFIDHFNDNSNGWDTYNVDNEYMTADVQVANGVYDWTINNAKKSFSTWGTKSSGKHTLGDFDVYVDARLNPDSADNLCYGLRFRSEQVFSGANFYAFDVCNEENFQVYYYDGVTSNWITLHTSTKSDAIHPNEWNTLGVSARGTHFTFTINDWTVAQLDDSRLKAGDVGVFVEVFQGQSGTILFDNFALQPR